MKYEITIRQLEPYTKEELEAMEKRRRDDFSMGRDNRYSTKFFHETRVLQAEVSKEEFEAVKKAIVNVM